MESSRSQQQQDSTNFALLKSYFQQAFIKYFDTVSEIEIRSKYMIIRMKFI